MGLRDKFKATIQHCLGVTPGDITLDELVVEAVLEAARQDAPLLAELKALKASQSWQPIETAPKHLGPDDPMVLMAFARGHIHIGYPTGQRVQNGPTHWQPLPTPPKEA